MNRFPVGSVSSRFLHASVAALAILFGPIPLRADTTGEEFNLGAVASMEGRKIVGVRLEPDLGVEDPMQLVGIEPFSVLSAELVRRVIEKVWGTGKVAKVSVYAEPKGEEEVVLVVESTLRMYLHDIVFIGNKNIKADELKEVVGFRPDMEFFDDTATRISGLIEEHYTLRGYPSAKVEVAIEPLAEPGKLKLRLKVDEGKAIKMWKVSFTGNPVLGPLKLRKITGIKSGDPYDQIAIAEGIERLRHELRVLGYYNSDIRGPQVNLDEEGRLLVEIWTDPGPLFTVEFVGNDHLSGERLREVIELDKQPGLNLAVLEEMAEVIEDYYRKLGFTTVSVQPEMAFFDDRRRGLALFNITEGKRIWVKEILFEGNIRFSSSFLRRVVEGVLNKSIKYDMLLVEPSFEVIDSLGIGGKPSKPARTFRKKAVALAPWKPKRIFLKEAYREAAEQIQKLYASEGFLDAEVSEPAVQIDPSGEAMTVTLVVREGVRTWIKEVSFEGAESVEHEELMKAVKVKPNEPFNGLAVKEAEHAILNLYLERGYRFAQVTSDVRFSDDESDAFLTFKIQEGPMVTVGDVAVRGNLSTRKGLILDRITLKPGTTFTLKKQNQSSTYLRELGIFNSVVISMEEPSVVENRKTVLIQVSEKKPQFLELRAGASSGEGLRGGMEYGYRNLLGYALDFAFMVHLNYRFFFVGTTQYFPEWYREELTLAQQLERNIAVRFGVPHLPKVGRWLTLQASFGHLRKNSNLYGLTQNSVYAGFIVSPLTQLHLNLQAGFEDSDVGTNRVAERALAKQIQDLPLCTPRVQTECLSPEESRALRAPVGKTAFTVLGTDFTLDLRDNAFNPTRGARLSMGLSWIRSTSHAEQVHRMYADNEEFKSWKTYAFSNLLRNTLSISGYIPLRTRSVVLVLHGAIGYIIQLQDRSVTFADRLFYLGGSQTMRGFPEESLCASESPPGLCIHGGNLMINYRVELLFPIYRELGGAVFSDMGNLWRDPQNFSVTHIRATVGAGIRYITPIGPLNLSYGVILERDKARGEPFGALHFSIGRL